MFSSGWLQPCDATCTAARARVKRAGLVLLFCASPGILAQTPLTPIQPTEQSASVHGVVLNAYTNQPVPRVLVQTSGQSMLTGHDGKFQFAGLNGTMTEIRAIKPGFYAGFDPIQPTMAFVQVGSPDEVQVRLYPEALLTGTLTDPAGDPLPQIVVQALRRADDESGGHWMMQGQTTSNADGQFRLPLPDGDYVIETQYAQPRYGSGQAVLPTIFPAIGSGGDSAADAGTALHLAGGSEQHLDLHPLVRRSHTVHLAVDSPGGSTPLVVPQIQARLANGLVFYPSTRGSSEKQGEIAVPLPSGSYVLSATSNGRDDASSYGETKVTVADEDVSGVTIHMQQATELTVEIATDPAAGSAETGPGTSGFGYQLGIFLQKVDTGLNLGNDNVSPQTRRGGPLSFSLLPGVYRLRSNAYSPWFIESASAGGTNLLTQDLVIDGGSSALPLRLAVDNRTATINGTVKLNGSASASYVYFIAEAPSASPVISSRTGQEGTFSRGLIPPGSYRVLASENRCFFNLTDPVTQRRFASYMTSVTVAAGETASINLNAVPASEWKP